MNDDEFQKYVIEKLDNIEHRMSNVESNFRWMKGLLYFFITLLGALGLVNLHYII